MLSQMEESSSKTNSNYENEIETLTKELNDLPYSPNINKKKGISTISIVGIILGCLALLIIVLNIIIFIMKRKKTTSEEKTNENISSETKNIKIFTNTQNILDEEDQDLDFWL